MNISDEITRLTEAKENLASAIIEKGGDVPSGATLDIYGDLVRQLTSGGIIEVSELPSADINKDAVYKVTERYEYSPLALWVITSDGVTNLESMLPNSASLSSYIVAELPSDMLVSDMNSFVLHVYILEETGVAYANISDSGVIPVSMMIFGGNGYDKGWIDDINSVDYSNPECTGVYTTRLVYKDFSRWYIRSDDVWQELSAHININGTPNVLQGVYEKTGTVKITKPIDMMDITPYILDYKTIPTIEVDIPSTGLLISGNLYNITKEFFYDPTNGGYPNYIRNGCFYYYGNLRNIEFPEGVWYIGSEAFASCIQLELTELPESITSIEYAAFRACSSLALTKLPSGINEISSETFAFCTSLALTELPENITSIGHAAFRGCYNLTISELPAGLISLGDGAFEECIGLTSITFKGTPSELAEVFRVCDNLTVINVPWSEGAIEGSPWGAYNATINYDYMG